MTTDKTQEPNPPTNDLLWQPGTRLDDGEALAPPAREPETPTREQLQAYARRELRSPERERVEEALVRDPEVRARLAELAEVTSPAPSPEARERVLQAYEREMRPARNDRSALGKILQWPGTRRAPARAAFAALAAALLFAVLWLRSPVEPLPSEVWWQVEAQGTAVVRGDADETPTTVIELSPDTVLQLDAGPSRAIRDVEFALFRLLDGGAERLELGDDQVTVERGAAEIRARAADLLGSEPQSGRLILVIARPGEVPTADELLFALDPRTGEFRAAETWRAHALSYRLTRSP